MATRAPATKRKRTAETDGASSKVEWDSLTYLTGFGNEFQSERLEGALPKGQNSPQRCPYGLYAEQLSGTAFTVPRAGNLRTWLYRIRPGVLHNKFAKVEHAAFEGGAAKLKVDPNQFRWGPIPHAAKSTTFLQGLQKQAGSDKGLNIYVYACNASMDRSAINNSDGDFLIVPQEGTLNIWTECGPMQVAPREIAVMPRGMRWSVRVGGPSRGYVLEVVGRHFKLPDLGPIGANGLANPRDFETPSAAYEDVEAEFTMFNIYENTLWSCTMDHSPFDVVAWHGNYVPYKYNLDKFCCMNSVTYDHPDPSIYTVLTCPSESPGTAIADFVIFPPRWMVMEHSFRPPYYHRNIMTEYMGMIYGNYDAKVGFVPGGSSLHSATTPHGPDAATFHAASNDALKPFKFDSGLAFMFETSLMLRISDWALKAPHREVDYPKCWAPLPKLFDGVTKDVAVPKKPAVAAGAGAGAGAGSSASS